MNVPRPSSDRPEWSAAESPRTPIANPAFQNGDVFYDAVPDDVTASLVYGSGAVFAFKPRVGNPYLAYAVPDRTTLLLFPLGLARSVRALYVAPDGVHVVYGADAQVTVPLPASS